jgi:hypothetical protein
MSLLYGLVALAVPPIIHLLSRRRFDTVDWAAMQFLRISPKTRQRVFFENITLMFMRMAIIGIFVAALCQPEIDRSKLEGIPGVNFILGKVAERPSHDIVFIIDGSYSMGYVQKITQANGAVEKKIAHDVAKESAMQLLNELPVGDSVAVIQAKQQPITLVPELSSDLRQVREKLEQLAPPRGGIDFPKSVNKAIQMLTKGKNRKKEIIIFTDGQRQGWADPRTMERWELLVRGLATPADIPLIWVMNVVPDRPADVPNWSISPIRTTRAVTVAGREVKFKYDLQLLREKTEKNDKNDKPVPSLPPPKTVYFDVDGKQTAFKHPPVIKSSEAIERISEEFRHSFSTPGSHLVSVRIDDDELPGDNRRDFAVEVLSSLPILIVDGDTRPNPKTRGSDFIHDALAPVRDKLPAFNIRTISISEFSGDSLNRSNTADPAMLPRVVVLHNIAELRIEQSKALEMFLNNGGGVLMTLGPRVNGRLYNDELFRDGHNWMPARLLEAIGDENDLEHAVRPVGSTLEHPALEMFKKEQPGGFSTVKFPRYWKLEPGPESSVIAGLSNRAPLFIEKSVGKGRMILSAVPLDNSWRTDLHTNWEFVVLSHELIYYLASARGSDVNLLARQPIIYHPLGEPPIGITLEPPEDKPRRLDVKAWPLIYDDTAETGVYKLVTDTGKTRYYVVQPDSAESNLAACTDAERQAVARMFPRDHLRNENDRSKIVTSFRQADAKVDLWKLFLVLMLVLLTGEVLMTRRLVRKHPPTTE